MSTIDNKMVAAVYVHVCAAVYVINKLVRIFINHLNVYRSMWSTTPECQRAQCAYIIECIMHDAHIGHAVIP